jgi:glucosamine--fructose-6-phosphate aminotransferase (isomerizing)
MKGNAIIMEPSVLINQAQDLANVMREKTGPFTQIVEHALTPEEIQLIRRVFIFGDGDSYHAARAMEMAFENIADIPCEPMSSQRFLDYQAEWLRVKEPNGTLVIGISASGKTQRVIQGLSKANKYGGLTIALTGTSGSQVSKIAQRTICVDLPDMGPSPGIRTYNASLMGLGLLALYISDVTESQDRSELMKNRDQFTHLADAMDETILAAEIPAKKAATELKDAQAMMFLGSGPSYGTALFCAAKIVEAAGVFAVGQDLEEWAHVERFAYPTNMPVFIIAPPGRSYQRAAKLAHAAHHYGRRVVAVINDGDTEISPHVDYVFPIPGYIREEFSPLVFHIATNFFASYLTEYLERKPFQSDKPEIREKYQTVSAFQLSIET